MITTIYFPTIEMICLTVFTVRFNLRAIREDPAARKWLDEKGPSTVLETKDRWQLK